MHFKLLAIFVFPAFFDKLRYPGLPTELIPLVVEILGVLDVIRIFLIGPVILTNGDRVIATLRNYECIFASIKLSMFSFLLFNLFFVGFSIIVFVYFISFVFVKI